MVPEKREKHVSSLYRAVRLFLLAAPFLALSIRGSAQSALSETGFFFDTVVSITLYGTEDSEVMDGCFSLLSDYEQMLSRTAKGSDVWKINHSGGEAVNVSEETASLIETALSFCRLSGGAFDITLAPVTDLWDFQDNPGILPDQESLSEALSHVGYQTVSVDGTLVTLSDPEASIDLGGIAKGYIADRIRDYLLSEGVESALINLGGNILTVGAREDGSDWRIGVRTPFGKSSEDLIAVVPCSGQAVVTSGSYERYFELDGVIYHHILDPQTGFPVQNGLSGVTILSGDSTSADALSTACFVLGLEDGMKLIESSDAEALFVTEDMEVYRSSGFPDNS